MEPTQLPKLPGFSFSDPTKTKFHKHQMFNVRGGHMTESTKLQEEVIDPSVAEELKNSQFTGYQTRSVRTPKNKAIPRNPPAWLKHDRQVLRFYAYFQEPVQESPSENFRVRKCVIMHHLDDETTYVTEPKVENSGIPQGVFIKKHRVPKREGGHYTWGDFGPRKNLEFYGRVFRIVDCDDFTRNFYEEAGYPLEPAEPFPEDNFDKTRLMVNFKQRPGDAMDYKEYNEVKLGGGHPNRNLKSFLDNDRKVLSLNVLWNDTSYDGGLKFYKANYYLSDDTMEIKELKQVNSGTENFSMMLKRMKVPRSPILTPCPALSLRKEEHYRPIDLVTGNHIHVYGKDLLVYDCDEFTRRWYIQNLGNDMTPIKISRSKDFVPSNPIPPHNGYGTEEDSIGNVLRLRPNPPKPDMYKMFDNDQHVMRFEAKLVSPNSEDDLRKFIVGFYPSDDTIKVYEVVDRNSGIVGGKFLERRKYKNPYTNTYYKNTDHIIGNTVILQGYRFFLTKCDDYTHNYMEARPREFPQASYRDILKKITSHSSTWGSRQAFLIKILENIDEGLGKTIPYKEFLNALEQLEVRLTYQEEATLLRHWDKGNFTVDMEEVYRELQEA